MAVQIRKAQRSKSHLKLVIDGVSGSGKTYSSLQIARGIGPDSKVLLIDTENGSGELYSHLYDYDYIRLTPPYSPAKYVEAIEAAIANGNTVIVIDSLTHCWKYILAYKETLDSSNPRAGFTNWAKAKLLFDEVKTALLNCPAHVICTLRAGSEYAESFDSKGNKKFDKVGTKPIAEPDLEYEFTLALRIERSHLAIATKDRTERFDLASPFTPSPTTGRTLYEWLNQGSGELSHEWAGAFKGEESARALSEAERLGVGGEGETEETLVARAKEELNRKRREANAIIKTLKLDEDKSGLQTFSALAKENELDPLEVFYDFAVKREGLTKWSEFLKILDELVRSLEEGKKVEGESETADPGTVSKSTEEGTTSSEGTAEKTEGGGENSSPESSSPDSAAVEKLRKLVTKSKDYDLLLGRVAELGVDFEDVLVETVSAHPKAFVADFEKVLATLEARGR